MYKFSYFILALLTRLFIYVSMYHVKFEYNYTLIQRGGGTGPMKPGNRWIVTQVPIPAGYLYPGR